MGQPRTGAEPPKLPSLQDGEAARRSRDQELEMSERLERVHQLCAQLSSLKPISPERPD